MQRITTFTKIYNTLHHDAQVDIGAHVILLMISWLALFAWTNMAFRSDSIITLSMPWAILVLMYTIATDIYECVRNNSGNPIGMKIFAQHSFVGLISATQVTYSIHGLLSMCTLAYVIWLIINTRTFPKLADWKKTIDDHIDELSAMADARMQAVRD